MTALGDDIPAETDSTPETDSSSPKKGKAKEKSQPMISYTELFRYTTGWDYVLLLSAFVAALLQSLVYPIAIVVYSELVAMFIDRTLGQGTSSGTIGLPLFGGGKIL